MALKIKPKRSATGGNVPSTSNLDAGEIAINLADKKLYVRDTSNNVLELTTRTVESLDNVNISGLTNEQILQYNSTSGNWENSTNSGSWTAGSGFIYNTSTVGIGTATPDTNYKLDVSGAAKVSTLEVGGVSIDGIVPPVLMTKPTITDDYTIPAGYNASASNDMSIDGATLSIGAGATLTMCGGSVHCT
jgi:hypothetical protein